MTGQDLLNRASAIRDDQFLDTTFQQHRMLLTGGLIGVAAGGYIGYVRKTNLLVTALLGGISGLIIAGVLLPK